MAVLIVPRFDPEAPWPTLGPQLVDFVQERCIYGPGSLHDQPAWLDPEKVGFFHSLYEVYPQGHRLAGRRRFKRGSISIRKGVAKTELMAWVAYCELHPESPVRCDGFDAYGEPVGRPVMDPYIPLMAVTVKQVEELAYGALKHMCEEGPDSHLFDASLERILRLNSRGREDGKCVTLSQSPGAADGGRTTFQGFDEPHRLILPRQRATHETMLNNIDKRALEDPWTLYTGTAGEPGEQSVAEDTYAEAKALDEGSADASQSDLYFFYRWAEKPWKMEVFEERVEAIKEATGPLIPEYAPGQFEGIARNWNRKGADLNYLERVWTNRWIRSAEQAFDPTKLSDLMVRTPNPFAARRPFVTGGFDGARFRDSTAFVLTDIPTGIQMMHSLWERPKITINPETGEPVPWQIDEAEVDAAMKEIQGRFAVWRFNCDPPYWTEPVGRWAGKYENVEEWLTNQMRQMAVAIQSYTTAYDTGAVKYLEDHKHAAKFKLHIEAAGKRMLNMYDDEGDTATKGKQLYILRKLHPERKFDGAMAAILSWEARLAALKAGAKPPLRRTGRVRAIGS